MVWDLGSFKECCFWLNTRTLSRIFNIFSEVRGQNVWNVGLDETSTFLFFLRPLGPYKCLGLSLGGAIELILALSYFLSNFSPFFSISNLLSKCDEFCSILSDKRWQEINIYPFSVCFLLHSGLQGLLAYLSCHGVKAGWHRKTTNHTQTHTSGQFRKFSVFLDCFMHTERPGFEPTTFWLQCDSTNHCTTVLPMAKLVYCWVSIPKEEVPTVNL